MNDGKGGGSIILLVQTYWPLCLRLMLLDTASSRNVPD